jgi:type II secretory pathway pseudopilin PulG
MISNAGKLKTFVSQMLIPVVITAIVLTIAAVSIPNLLRSRIAANEAFAVRSIRTINAAVTAYSEQHPGTGYPQKLSDLSPYVDANLAIGQKSGYRFRYMPETDRFDGVVKSFRVEAVPVANETGIRRFSSDETGAIRSQTSLTQPEQLLDGESQQPQQPRAQSPSPRMMRRATLNMIVAEPLAVGEKMRVLASQLGGYVDSVRSVDEGSGATQTSIVIRVPADRFEEARRQVRAMGERVKDE